MAKLEGVKALDMVNGEITKVSYGGAEYKRVEGEAQAGDLALALESGLDTTAGVYYAVTNPIDGGFIYRDDANDPHFWDCDGTFVIFRKVAAGTNPSVEERVAKAEGEIESLKSDVAALKGEAEYKRISVDEAQDGDYVKFDEAPSGYLTAGKYYEIDYIDSNGDPRITDDDGDDFDTFCLDDDEFGVYRKVSAASVEAEPTPERLKVGDYAKVVGRAIINEKGDIVKIIQDTGGNVPFKVESVSGLYKEWRSEESLVRATDEEVAEAKRAAAEAAERKKWAEIGREVGEYRVGDIFRNPDGILYEVTRIDDRLEFPIRFTNLEGDDDGYTRKANLTLITPVEARFDR
ncbi:hypothetical protein FZC71_01000 [Bacillus subtilis]|nr:hypothetical protein FZC71_01000 [Bacillus subtilis]